MAGSSEKMARSFLGQIVEKAVGTIAELGAVADATTHIHRAITHDHVLAEARDRLIAVRAIHSHDAGQNTVQKRTLQTFLTPFPKTQPHVLQILSGPEPVANSGRLLVIAQKRVKKLKYDLLLIAGKLPYGGKPLFQLRGGTGLAAIFDLVTQ